MEDKNLSFFGILKNTLRPFLKLGCDVIQLTKLEAELAKKSLIHIIVLVYLILPVLTCLWLCISIVIFLFMKTHLDALSALLWLIMGHIILISILSFFIFKAKKHLSFPITRKQIAHLTE